MHNLIVLCPILDHPDKTCTLESRSLIFVSISLCNLTLFYSGSVSLSFFFHVFFLSSSARD